MPESGKGVGTEELTEPTKSDVEVLEGRGREYTIADKKVFQKPLVLRDFHRLFEHLMELLATAASANPKLLKPDFEFDAASITPETLVSIAHTSETAAQKVYDIVALVLREDREWLLDNMGIPMFTRVLADLFELNDVREIVKNFQRMGTQVRQYFKGSLDKK